MRSGNFYLAFKRLRASKWTSMLTMFGIIVGVVSVVTIVSLGEGVKKQVVNQSNKIGSDLVTIRPGKLVSRDKDGHITNVNTSLAYGFGTGSLSEQDVSTVKRVPGVKEVSPINLLTGTVEAYDQKYEGGYVLGTDANFPGVIKQKVEFGSYFTSDEENRQLAIIGKRVAEQLFEENVPVGQSLKIRGQEFVVRGIFEEFGSTTLGQGIDLNKAVFVPRPVLKNMTGDASVLTQVLVKPDPQKENKNNKVSQMIHGALVASHGGGEDVTVLRQDESLAVTSGMLEQLTQLVTAMAVVSLLVGGIGIMNIMLVSVSERTHEIGIRKAIGATNRQIRNQFMAEAIVISLVGGILGVICSYALSFIIRISTNLHPSVSLTVVGLAVAVAVGVGVVFGTVPAVKAARKDPIESLRITS